MYVRSCPPLCIHFDSELSLLAHSNKAEQAIRYLIFKEMLSGFSVDDSSMAFLFYPIFFIYLFLLLISSFSKHLVTFYVCMSACVIVCVLA